MKKTNSKSNKSHRGFTIIEVVLVLAIAGLIFLMVFIALPNLQRTQRDTQRRDDIARLASSLTQFITNNNRLPDATEVAAGGAFRTNYLNAAGDTFQDPSIGDYTLELVENNPAAVVDIVVNPVPTAGNRGALGTISIVKNARCDAQNEGRTAANQGARNFAVLTKLEGAGYYCTDNN